MTSDSSFSRAVLAPLLAVAAILLLALIPDIGPHVTTDNQAVDARHGRIVEIVPPRADEAFRPPYANVLLLDGPKAGQTVQAYLEGPGGSQIVANYQPGDEVVVTTTLDAGGQPYVAVADRWRAPLLGAFVLLFAVAVVVVGGVRGVRALLALGLTIALILKVLLPLVIAGYAPVPLAVVTATVVTIVTILLTEGWSRASGAAILGTSASLALSGLLGAAATALASFTYSAGSDLAFLQTSDGNGLDLRGLLLAAFILGAVGVLDDVTVTQARLVEQLVEHGATGRGLFRAGFDVGRSHIAATVNTLFLAYVGVGLPLLVTIIVSNQPAALTLNSEEVATEVIRTLVGSMGILAAVPLTTVVAALLLDRSRVGRDRVTDRRALAGVGVATGVVAVALAATAVMPLGQGRASIPVDQLGPSSIPGPDSGRESPDQQSPPDNAPLPTDEPAASQASSNPDIVSEGAPYAVSIDGESLEITVTSIDRLKTSAGTRLTIDVRYRNDGPDPFDVDPSAWTLITSKGEDVVLRSPATGGLEEGDLASGSTRSGHLEGTVRDTVANTFIAFTDPDGVVRFAVPADGS